MPVDKDKIRALADRIRQNGKVDVNRFVDGGPESRHHNGRDYTLDEYKEEKRNEIIGAAVDKALSRKYGVAPRIGDPSCLYTVTDNFGRKYRVAGNQSFMADPGRYGFIVNGPLDNSRVGDIYQFIDNGGKPYHAVMITGYDDDGNPLVSYSHGNAPAYNPDNIYSPDVQMEANERWEMSETPESFGENDYLVRQYGNYDNYFKSRMREWSEISSSDYRRNKPLWRAYGLADTAHEFEGDNVPDSYETYRFVGTPDDNSRWEAEYGSFPKAIGSLPRVDVSLPMASRLGKDGLFRRYEGGGEIGEDDPEFIGPVAPRSVRVANLMRPVSDMYTVAKGDSLSKIAQRVYGDPMKYTMLAQVNGIDNPDVIYPGQEIVVPVKFDKPLKMSEIPTANKVNVIDNYSPNYNYIVEGDKVYYSRKGRDAWVDISDNDTARRNLLNFLGDKYDFRGYEDNEREIRDLVNSGSFDYMSYHSGPSRVGVKKEVSPEPLGLDIVSDAGVAKAPDDTVSPPALGVGIVDEPVIKAPSVEPGDIEIDAVSGPDIVTEPRGGSGFKGFLRDVGSESDRSDGSFFGRMLSMARDRVSDGNNEDLKNLFEIYDKDGLSGVYDTVVNGLSRKLDKAFMNNESEAVMAPPDLSIDGSDFGLVPQSFTGDTLRYKSGVLPREYFIPESIDMSQYRFGVRNRGDNTPIDTEGAIVTAFTPFEDYADGKLSDDRTYIGIDKDGNFKVGNGSDFGPGDRLTRTYANEVYDFAKDGSGNYKFRNDAKHGNANHNVAVVNVRDEKTGKLKESGAFNILVGKGDSDGTTYGSVTGGRVLVKVGNELRLLSGSVRQIEDEFEAMKRRQKTDHGTFYTLDNGSFNKALRTYDKRLTSGDLSNYDRKNTSGGNFVYIVPGDKPDRYRQDTVRTPNVRTEESDSYKAGHPLENANKGVVLHYTAFNDGNDLTGVTNHFLDPGTSASAHVVIAPDGTRRVFADDDQVTFHAGYSTWDGVDDVNDFMHGIEFQAPGPDVPLTDDQVKSAVEYLEKYIRKHNIPLENITTHEIVRDNWLRSHSGDEARRKGVKPKHDLSPAQWSQVIEALKRKVYYEKPPKDFDISDYRIVSDLLTRRPVDVLTDRDDWDYANGGLLRKFNDGGPEGDIDLPYSGGGHSGGRGEATPEDFYRERMRGSDNKWERISNARYFMANDSLRRSGASPEDAERLARILGAQSALETGWVDDVKGNNFAGYMSNGKRMIFDSPSAFWDYHISNLDRKWPGWRDAKDITEYYNVVNHPELGLDTKEKFYAYNRAHRDNPVYIYAPTWENGNYLRDLSSIYDRYINKYVNLDFSEGGGIHIKPSHRGRLTELKKRTGKTEAELYNDGNPAHKKMVVFARNARKWHSDGGAINKALDNGDIDVIRAAINNVLARKISGK